MHCPPPHLPPHTPSYLPPASSCHSPPAPHPFSYSPYSPPLVLLPLPPTPSLTPPRPPTPSPTPPPPHLIRPPQTPPTLRPCALEPQGCCPPTSPPAPRLSPLQVNQAEARGRRAGMIEKEIAEAQVKAQLANLAEEKEVVQRHRLSAEVLAQLSEKVCLSPAPAPADYSMIQSCIWCPSPPY